LSHFYDILLESTAKEQSELVASPVILSALNGALSKSQYLGFLGQAYHHVRHTVPLLMACGSRLCPSHAWLQGAIAEYIEEEIGHEEWILDDIEACGGDPDAVRRSEPWMETETMVAYAYHQIDRGNPVGFFGMVHVLEGTSVSVATRAADSIRQSLGLPQNAFSYLTSHGSLDQEHVQFFRNLMNRIESAGDQRAIIHCARRFFNLYGAIFRALLGHRGGTADGCV
jgi:pyrroloquinoline quinone (PQQ) biosynthesis protein C